MTIFTGYEVSAGTFKTEKGETIDYDNRKLHFLTDDGMPDGSAGLLVSSPVKIKTSALAEALGCDVYHVDGILQRCIFSQVDFKVSIVNGTPLVTGFKVVGDGVKAINGMYGKAEKS